MFGNAESPLLLSTSLDHRLAMFSIKKTILLSLAVVSLTSADDYQSMHDISCSKDDISMLHAAVVGGREIVANVLMLRMHEDVNGVFQHMVPSVDDIEHKYFGDVSEDDQEFITSKQWILLPRLRT